MSTLDIVTQAVENLESKVKAISAVRNRTLYVYNQGDLLNFEKKVDTPCVGVIYVRTATTQEGEPRTRAFEVVCNVVLLGGDTCVINSSKDKQTSTQILAEVREAIMNRSEGDLGWVFHFEEPIHVATSERQELFGYFQQWSVIYCWNPDTGWSTGG